MPPKSPLYFPIFLNLRGKPCLVVGGGPIALGKARGLAKAGARVTAVAKDFVTGFGRLRSLRKVKRGFRSQDLDGPRPWLVVAATDDAALHQRIVRLCRRKNLWLNVVDVTELCDFIYPAVLRRGPATVAVSTGGASPAFAKFLRRDLQKKIGRDYVALARALKQSRAHLKKLPMAARKKFLARVTTPAWLARLKKNGAEPLIRYIGKNIA